MEHNKWNESNIWLLNGIVNALHEPSWMIQEFLSNAKADSVAELSNTADGNAQRMFFRAEYEETLRQLTRSMELIGEAVQKIQQLAQTLDTHTIEQKGG